MSLLDWFTGTSFQSRLRSAVEALNLTLVSDNARGGALSVLFAGARYLVTVHRRPMGKVAVVVHSNVKFPPGQLPKELLRAIARRNRQLPRCDWTDLNGDNDSRFVVFAQGPQKDFDADLLRAALQLLLPEAHRFDQALEEEGYVN